MREKEWAAEHRRPTSFMESPLFLTDLLTRHEPGRARRPCRAGKSAAQVQIKRRLTGDGSPYRPRARARFMGSSPNEIMAKRAAAWWANRSNRFTFPFIAF